MKKVIAFMLVIMCLILLVSCTAKTEKQDLAVYSFFGADEHFSVSNGVIVLNGEEETFSGGELTVLQEEFFSDIVSYDADFYILKNGGDKRTVLSSSVLDMTGDSVRLNGDSLGKISGETILTNYKMIDEEDWQNNLFFELTVTDKNGEETVYELQMNLTKITE